MIHEQSPKLGQEERTGGAERLHMSMMHNEQAIAAVLNMYYHAGLEKA